MLFKGKTARETLERDSRLLGPFAPKVIQLLKLRIYLCSHDLQMGWPFMFWSFLITLPVAAFAKPPLPHL